MGPTQNKIYCHIKLVPNQTWVQIRDVMEIDGGQLSKILEKLTLDNIIEKFDGKSSALV